MDQMIVKFPYFTRKRKLETICTVNEKTFKCKGKSSARRVRLHRQKLKEDPAKWTKYNEKKVEENKKYKVKLKTRRKQDKSFNDRMKEKQNQWKRASRLRQSAKKDNLSTSSTTDISGSSMGVADEQDQAHHSAADDATRKRCQRLKERLPCSPARWSMTINHLVKTASPRKKRKLDAMLEQEAATKVLVTDSTVPAPIIQELDLQKTGRPTLHMQKVKRKLSLTPEGGAAWKGKKEHQQYLRRINKFGKMHSQAKRLNQSWKLKIQNFLEDNSRIMPNKRDTITFEGEIYAKRHLLCSKYEAYTRFKAENPTYQRKFSTFRKQIPRHIRRLDPKCRRVCVCVKDFNIEQRVESLNTLAMKVNLPDLRHTVRELSNVSLCDFEQFPHRHCVDRICDACGIKNITEMYAPLLHAVQSARDNGITIVNPKWRQWEQFTNTYTNKNGEKVTNKSWQPVQKTANVEDVIKQTADLMGDHSSHIFRADFQHHMESKLLSHSDLKPSLLPLDQACVVMDFSENITIQHQDEIESAHWVQKQITLHPMFLVRHSKESTEDNRVLMKESLVIISDDLKHDSNAVFSFTSQLLTHVSQNPGPCGLKVLHRFSDNCATQYKCKTAFSHLSIYQELFGVQLKYHYTEAGHGKGPSDGIGATVKQKLDRLILAGEVVHNAYEAYLALARTLSNTSGTSQRRLLYLPSSRLRKTVPDKSIPMKMKTLVGTQKFHMVHTVQLHSTLLCQDLSCTCEVCIGNTIGPCFYGQWILPEQYFDSKTGKSISIVSYSSCTNDNIDKATHSGVHGVDGTVLDSHHADPNSNRDIARVGDTVAVMLSSKNCRTKMKQLHVAKVLDIDEQQVNVLFMEKVPDRDGIYTWPSREDKSWENIKQLLCVCHTPEYVPQGSSRRRILFRITDDDIKRARDLINH